MFGKKTSSAHAFVGAAPTAPPAPRPRRKRNRGVEQMRRRLRDFQRKLYARASALHDVADDLRQDDPDARYNEDIPTSSAPRIRAREIEAIADNWFWVVCGK